MPDRDDEQKPNELIAYLDGELSEREREEIERRIATDSDYRREADELKRAWDLLDFLPQAEPSPAFASRTLERLSVVRPAATSVRPATTSEIMDLEVPRNPWARRLAIAAAALAIFGVGLVLPGTFLKKAPPELTQAEMEEQMAKDLRVIDHLNLYEPGADLNFVAALDDPDLFGNTP